MVTSSLEDRRFHRGEPCRNSSSRATSRHLRSPGCAVIFEDSSGPLLYRGDVRRSTREVRGESCRQGLVFPTPYATLSVDWGEGGYREALRKASEQAQGAPLSDVRADLHLIGILIWREECLVVTAQAP